MASQQKSRIQTYLEQNKIGPLFEALLVWPRTSDYRPITHLMTPEPHCVLEDWVFETRPQVLWQGQEMMAELISRTPDHPVPFLISHLQEKHGGPARAPRALLGSAALWAQSGIAEHRDALPDLGGPEKPRQGRSRKPKKSKSALAVSTVCPAPSPESKSLPRLTGRLPWDSRTRLTNCDSGELNQVLRESRKLGKSLEGLSRGLAASDEPDQTGLQQRKLHPKWPASISDELSHSYSTRTTNQTLSPGQDPKAYKSSVVRPCVIGQWVGREESDKDPLAAEMLQPPEPRTKSEASPAGGLKVEPKSKGLREHQQHQRKLLAAMLSQESFDLTASSAPYAAQVEIDDEDDAMELLEDMDDLRMEGVVACAPTCTSKFSQVRGSHCRQAQAKVTLSICSRCARLQDHGLEDTRVAEAPASEQTAPETLSPASSVKKQIEEDDDEFEMVFPDVTGPCGPFWTSVGQDQQVEPLSVGRHIADVRTDRVEIIEGQSERGSLHSHPVIHTTLSPPNPSSGSDGLPSRLSDRPASQLSTRSQTSGGPASRPQTPLSSSSRPLTADSSVSLPITPRGHGNEQRSPGSLSQRSTPPTPYSQPRRSRPVTPTRQTGRTPSFTPTSRVGSSTPTKQDQFYQPQPWLVPSDTESEVGGVGAERV